MMNPISKYVSALALGVFFYGILSPAAVLLRLMGYDPLRRRFESGVSTYRIVKELGSYAESANRSP